MKIYMDQYERFIHDPFLKSQQSGQKQQTDLDVVKAKMKEIEDEANYDEILKLRQRVREKPNMSMYLVLEELKASMDAEIRSKSVWLTLNQDQNN